MVFLLDQKVRFENKLENVSASVDFEGLDFVITLCNNQSYLKITSVFEKYYRIYILQDFVSKSIDEILLICENSCDGFVLQI